MSEKRKPAPVAATPKSGGEEEVMEWELDPEESISDYTIEVTWIEDDGSSTASKSYHVHKGFLVAGTRKCQYFQSALKNTSSQSYQESKSNTSRIGPLPKLAATSMPLLLNYLYGAKLEV